MSLFTYVFQKISIKQNVNIKESFISELLTDEKSIPYTVDYHKVSEETQIAYLVLSSHSILMLSLEKCLLLCFVSVF